ncbi:MAG: choice-of-anchor C family protein [Planctomycetota bacterium]
MAHNPVGAVPAPVDHVDITFSREVDGSSFTIDDIDMTGPAGPVSINPPEGQANNVWRITFAEQWVDGDYHVYVGPHVEDLDGTEMDQDGDDTPGEEPDDVYDARFSLLPILHNGGFEVGPDPGGSFTVLCSGSTAIPGWTVMQGCIDYVGGYWQPSDGSRSLDLNGGQTGGVGQMFSTEPGRTYRVLFDMSGNPDGGSPIKQLRVEAAMQTGAFEFDTSGHSRPANMGWVEQVWQFTATSAETTLAFYSLMGGTYGPAIDNVRVSLVEGADCNNNGVRDECDRDCGEPGGPCDAPGCGRSDDCNTNAVPDECDIGEGTSEDCNGNGIPDECEIACSPHDATIGSALVDRLSVDTSSAQAYIFDGDHFLPNTRITGFSITNTPHPGGSRFVTPLLFQNIVSGPNPGDDIFVVRGIGTGRTITASGTFTFDFELVNGTDVVPDSSAGYTFGFINVMLDEAGNRVAASTGVVDFTNGVAAGPGVSGRGSNAWRFTPTVAIPNPLMVGTVFGSGGVPLNNRNIGGWNVDRTYSSTATVVLSCPGDCNRNGIPDECDVPPICTAGPPYCSPDCNENLAPDECDIADGTSEDGNSNGIPDECEQLPDLVGSDLVVPGSTYTGAQIDVSCIVTNVGSAATTGTWVDCIYLSDDDQPGGDTHLACAERPDELDVAEWYDQVVAVTIPGVEVGDYWIIIRVDDGDAVPETEEANNDATVGPITINRPNLTIGDALDPMPTEAWTGRPIAVGWTVTNTGDAPAAGSWQDCVYLPADDVIGDHNSLGCMTNPVSLDAGDYYKRVGTFIVPAALAEGDYWIVVCPDAGSTMPEADEADNCTIAGPIWVGVVPCADLVPSNVEAPDRAAAGSMMAVDWIVTNVGEGCTDAPFWFDRVYLSRDQNLNEGTDKRLYPDIENLSYLDADEWYSQDGADVKVPGDADGYYYVIVKTDAMDDLAECREDNNIAISASVYIDPRPLPDLIVLDVDVAPASPWSGEQITVTWTAKNDDLGSIPTGRTWSNAVFLSGDFNSQQVWSWRGVAWKDGPLAAGESYSASATVTLPAQYHGLFQICIALDGHEDVNESNESNNVGCSDEFTIRMPPPADLEFAGPIVMPSDGSSGQPVEVTWTVRNGSTDTTWVSAWNDQVILTRDADPNTLDDNTALATYRHYGALGYHDEYSRTVRVTLPVVANGAYSLCVVTDVDDEVYEWEWEDNNSICGPINVVYAPPDLVVEIVTVLDNGVPAASVLSGTPVTVEWTVGNTRDGDTSEDSWSDRIYISADDLLEPNTDRALATVAHYGVLGAGESYAGTKSVMIPVEFSGPVAYIFVHTDHGAQVYESDDGNNSGVSDPFELIWAPPDLVVQAVTVEPVLEALRTFTVEWIVANTYRGPTPTATWFDRVYVSIDDALDANDPVLQPPPSPHNGVLGPGETYPATWNITIPIYIPGPTVYFFVKTDYDNRVYEYDNENNVYRVGPIEIAPGPPDLIIENISAPGGAVAGEPLSLSWTVRNVGGATGAGSWHDRVYLSANRWLEPDEDTPFDPPVEHTGDLPYNATYVANATVPLPADLANQFYLIVETDSNSEVVEWGSAEANNTRYVSISLTPLPVDLQVTTVDAPGTALSGQNMQVTWTAANFGVGATPNGFWRDAVYLSPDQYLDPDFDYYLGYFDHSGILSPAGEPGDSYTRTESVRIPSGLSGPYYVFVCADINNHIFEQNDRGDAEENNCNYDGIATQVEVPPPADLMVTDIVVPPAGTLGENITIQWTVRNKEGTFPAQGSWHDSVYISADAVWDISDKKIGHVWHSGPLAPGAEYPEPESLTAPLPGVVPGDYRIIVRTDIRNEIYEGIVGEENNIAASMGQVDVQCWELQLNTIDDFHQLSTGTQHYYRIPDVPEGEDISVSLDSQDLEASAELYVRYGAIPDPGHYDQVISIPVILVDVVVWAQALIPSTYAGDYYVLVRGLNVPTGATPYIVGARLLEFEIDGIVPDRGGNVGTLTASIMGGRLTPDTVARLVSGETVIEGRTCPETTPTQMFVTFDLNGARAGLYDVEIEKPNHEPAEVLREAFEVVEGGGPNLEVNLSAPSVLRTNTPFTMYIEYKNSGNVDMAAPLFSLSAPQGIPLRLAPGENPWPGPVQVLGISMTGPPGVLQPGIKQRIPVYSQSPANPGDLGITLGMMVADATPIDWAAIEDDLRPDTIPPRLRAALWANLTVQIGSTWAGFLAAMNESATFLARAGKRTYDVRELFAAIIKNACGDLTPRLPLAARIDAFSPDPGLPLAFVPAATTSLAQRFSVGPLGRGWSHNFEYSLGRPDPDTVLVSLPGGYVRTFTREGSGPWQASPGDYGVLDDMGLDTYRITENDGLVWRFGPGGRLRYLSEPNGNHLTLEWSGDLLTGVSHSNGHQLKFEYNADGRIHRLTDHVGRQTEYIYDSSGEHLMQVTAPGGRVTLYECNPPAGTAADYALKSITFPDGTHRYYNYDEYGRLIGLSREGGAERVTLSYDQLGKAYICDALDNVSTLALGPAGELLTVQDGVGNPLSLDYDEAFNLTRMTATDGTRYDFRYDALGNLTQCVDPLGAVITLGHTADLSRLDWLRDARGNIMDFTSDPRGNLTRITYPDASYEQFGYDAAGNVVTVRNRRGQIIELTYDGNDRLIRKLWPDGRRFDYAYDAHGNLISASDTATGTITMEYDNRDLLTRIEYPGGYWFTFEYSDAGWRTRRTGHDGYVLNYAYDPAGRLERLTDGTGAEIIRYEYDAAGRLSRENKGNRTYTMYEYDAAGQILCVANHAPDGSIQSRFDYIYDQNGNPTSMVVAREKGAQETWLYGYDAIGQLTEVTYPEGRYVLYEYDAAGNRVRVVDDGVVTSYTTNSPNQYTRVGDATYHYDVDGNMTSKTYASGTLTYEYDVENRLTRVVIPGGETWGWAYDALGNRIGVTHGDAGVTYIHDTPGLLDVVAEYNADNRLIARYTHGIGLISRADANTAEYYAYDALGHTRQMTDVDGHLASTYDYDPFGAILHRQEPIPSRYGYVGRWGVSQEECGLKYMGVRYYAADEGRFLTPDPIGLASGDLNNYNYVSNNPTALVDPNGTVWWWVAPVTLGLVEGLVSGSISGHAEAIKAGLTDRAYWTHVLKRVGKDVAVNVSLNLSFAAAFKWLKRAHGAWFFKEQIVEKGSRLAGRFRWHVADIAGGFRHFGWKYVFGSKAVLSGHMYWLWSNIGGKAGLDFLNPYYPIVQLLRHWITIVTGVDPNEKAGPVGHAEMAFVPSAALLPYELSFENLQDATAPAQQVTITDELSATLDWRTFQLGEIAFGDSVVRAPEHRAHYVTEVELDNGLIVEVDAGLNVQTGTATWTLTAIDPETGELPEDPLTGLLPPNDPETHSGEGHVTFTIRPRPDLPTGTEITNSATIIFDINEPIMTNEVFNTVDAFAPNSQVTGPAGEVPDRVFDITWTGSDDPGGSGVVSYSIYYRQVGGPYTLWLITAETSATFTAPSGGCVYDFYSLASDGAGNTEALPSVPDTTITVAPQVPPAPTLGTATAVTVRLVDLGRINAGCAVEHAVFEETTNSYVGPDGRLTSEPYWQPLGGWANPMVRALSPSTEYSFRVEARSMAGDETPFGEPTVVMTSIQGDVNGDGLVTQGDVSLVQSALSTEYGDAGFDARADLNGDNRVTYADLGIVLANIREGDYNRDGFVTLGDYPILFGCVTGPMQGGLSSDCAQGDFDHDDDIDLADFAAFQREFGSD